MVGVALELLFFRASMDTEFAFPIENLLNEGEDKNGETCICMNP